MFFLFIINFTRFVLLKLFFLQISSEEINQN